MCVFESVIILGWWSEGEISVISVCRKIMQNWSIIQTNKKEKLEKTVDWFEQLRIYFINQRGSGIRSIDIIYELTDYFSWVKYYSLTVLARLN